MSGPIGPPGGGFGGPPGGGFGQPNPNFKPISHDCGIQPIKPFSIGGSGGMHDTFNVNPLGNISGGHTTIQVSGGQKRRMPW